MTTAGKIHGIDYADGSVAASRANNAELIKTGRVEIQQSSVSQLPFPENTFDLVTAVETQYYWPNLTNDMREILRVLKPGGTLLVVLEDYKAGQKEESRRLPKSVSNYLKYTTLSVAQQRELFSAAGYTDVQVAEKSKQRWLCAFGKKLGALA